ncbi:MAG: hypothetical protein K2M98_07155 [Muribaculum sp.]|nr:hypothetical protein [Muribaculum sp.]
MINRILIRMKVVQLLYSYMLTRNYFKLQDEPIQPTRDQRYAYATYTRLLMLLTELSGYHISVKDQIIRISPKATKINQKLTHCAASLAGNDTFKEMCLHDTTFLLQLRTILPALSEKVYNSSIYKEYSRKRSEISLNDEALMWKTIFRTVVMRDDNVLNIFSASDDFTNLGQERGLNMFDATLNEFAAVRDSLVSARNSLEESLDKAYDLYHAMLQLTIDLTNFRERQIEEAKNKYLPTPDDLNPDLRLIENKFVEQLRQNQALATYVADHNLSWENDDVMLRHLLDNILQSDIYKKYIESPVNTYVDDCDFWYDIMRSIIIGSDELAEVLESKSVFWNDDITIMGSFAMKTIRKYATVAEGTQVELLPKYKDDIDAKFGRTLFDVTVEHQDQYRDIINKRLAGGTWDPERLAFMDIVILETAIAELFAFESIPTVVTVNEYTEIANYYSTLNSGQFITGMLYAIIADLKQQGLLHKD